MSYRAAVITVSDRAFAGVYEDKSGPALCAMLREAGYEIAHTAIVPDEQERISDALIRCADDEGIDLILTTGGTGLSPRDVTPEATRAVLILWTQADCPDFRCGDTSHDNKASTISSKSQRTRSSILEEELCHASSQVFWGPPHCFRRQQQSS